ncbi:MAG TPA: GNAT family N-acetyltransferase [Balneolales bacterium]|nr:GNAT family N-acetyltransferase [Balneolales bacterium]
MPEYEIRPINPEEWLPDRCMSFEMPFNPKISTQKAGCASLEGYYTKGSRKRLMSLYQTVLNNIGCCGFVAWENGCVVGYNNFFPSEIAQITRFYGWGTGKDVKYSTLVHHCISLVQNPDYRRKEIGTGLINRSLDWAKQNGWHIYEVHNVLPDSPTGYKYEQKGCLGFWRRFGFEVTCSVPADPDTETMYGVSVRHSMALHLGDWNNIRL